MKRNKTTLLVGICMLILTLILSIGLVSYMRLDEPVFLYNYKECNILSQEGYYSKRNFDFSYITNLGDSRYVTGIRFPDVEAIEVTVIDPAYYLSSGSQDRYGPYAIRNVNVTVTDLDVTTSFNPIELNNGIVTFSNGDTMEVDFGRVILTNHGLNYSSVQFLTMEATSLSDTEYQNVSTFRATEALTLVAVESPLFKDLGDLLNLEVNGISLQDIEDMVLEKDDIITVTTHLTGNGHPGSVLTAYEIQPLLTWKDGHGDPHTQILTNINYRPYRFQLSGIVKYLKERGVL